MRMDFPLCFEYNKCTERRWLSKWITKLSARSFVLYAAPWMQNPLADALEISTSALFMYERGERIPRDQVKKRIAHYFGKTVEEIFFAE